MLPITEVAKKLGLTKEDIYTYGEDKAKITKAVNPKQNSHLILVTAVNPTPYGEGKTTVSIGLNDALRKLGKSSLAVLREPSLGPVFGLKGGATGGGKASIIPSQDINLHFTGDFHAITAANNLLCAAVDNHIYQGNALGIDPKSIRLKRCLDVNDRSLRDNFDITAASEVMAIFCLATDRSDLRKRLAHILIGYNEHKEPIYAKDLQVDGAMYLLLEQAFYPNLVQSLEGNPVLVHGGPFANIAHGCNSIVATKLGLGLADYVVTEAGFGSDLGAEKFLNIKCRKAGLEPSAIVLIATVQALKHSGIENLQAHIDHLKQYSVPFCVTINRFSKDKEEEIQELVDFCQKQGVKAIVSSAYIEGGAGSVELAKEVIHLCDEDSHFQFLYPLELSISEKIDILAKQVYHASTVVYQEVAKTKLQEIEQLGISNYPICVAKTPYSISDDAKKLGYPKEYTLTVRDLSFQMGSEMIIVLLNTIITMPGLPKQPNYESFE